MKRIVCGALAAAALTTGAFAYQVPNVNQPGNIIQHERINCDAQAQAEFLHALGLFAGTDKGFELERTMTRAEAAAMLCRFLGGEAEAEKGGFSHPFRDVPAWANNSVGWLYQKKLTYGVSAKRYGAAEPVTAQQFAAFLSRALTGEDDSVHRLLTESEAASLADVPFRRSYAVAMAVRALPMLCYRDEDGLIPTLAKKLMEQGVFTAEQFTEAAWDVIPPVLDEDTCLIADIPRGKCSEPGLSSVWNSVDSAQPYYYATREASGMLEIWQVDWKTMQAEQVGQQPLMGEGGKPLIYLGTIGATGTDYLLEKDMDVPTGRLFSISGGKVTLELSETEIGKSYLGEIPMAGEGFAFQLENGSCWVDRTGVHSQQATSAEGETTVLYIGSTSLVTQTVTGTEMTLKNVHIDTGEVISSFTVPQDIKDDTRTVSLVSGSFYGEAGFYTYDEATGELQQVLAEAVQDVTGNRDGGTAFYLTHAPGRRVYGMNGFGGDAILKIDHSTGEQETLVDASAGIDIAGFTDADVSGGQGCEFFSAVDVGMQHFDRFTYYYDCGTKKITVRDFEAGRPEVMDGFDYDNPTAYKKAYIAAEQARLDEVWNSKH